MNVAEEAVDVLTDVLIKGAPISVRTPVAVAELRASLSSRLRRP